MSSSDDELHAATTDFASITTFPPSFETRTLSKKRIEVTQIWITRQNSKKDDKSEIIDFSQEFT